jgi:redox-sensing transcriptional repressor
VICVPASSAQAVCDLAVKSGAQAIWNFAPSSLVAPKNVVIENVNLASSLAVLSHRLNANILKEEAKRGLGYPHTERE